MLIHTVLFWLHKNLQDDQLTEFRIGLETLKHIKSAKAIYIGSPAATEPRPRILLSTYDFCLTVVFENLEAHNAYQVDPIHKKFLENYSSYWKRVRIYDAD
jgi:hypothetical protein